MKTPTIYEQFENELKRDGYSVETIRGYVQAVCKLVWHYQRQPGELNDDEIREYLIYLLLKCKLSRHDMVRTISSLRAFFRLVLRRSEESLHKSIPSLKTKAAPETYTQNETERLLSVNGLQVKHHAMLKTLYALGKR